MTKSTQNLVKHKLIVNSSIEDEPDDTYSWASNLQLRTKTGDFVVKNQ